MAQSEPRPDSARGKVKLVPVTLCCFPALLTRHPSLPQGLPLVTASCIPFGYFIYLQVHEHSSVSFPLCIEAVARTLLHFDFSV